MAKKTSKQYSVGSWQGKPNYGCGLCAYASVDQAKFIAHMQQAHGVDATAPAEKETAAKKAAKGVDNGN